MKREKGPKRKMQEVQFNSVQEFLEFLPEEELRLVQALRQLVFECIPRVQEGLTYNVCYYRLNRGICFIWPSSVLWGKNKIHEGVRFGFTRGYLLQDELNYLDKGTRKQVYWRDFTRLEEEDLDILKSYLFEAALLDAEAKASGRKRG